MPKVRDHLIMPPNQTFYSPQAAGRTGAAGNVGLTACGGQNQRVKQFAQAQLITRGSRFIPLFVDFNKVISHQRPLLFILHYIGYLIYKIAAVSESFEDMKPDLQS